MLPHSLPITQKTFVRKKDPIFRLISRIEGHELPYAIQKCLVYPINFKATPNLLNLNLNPLGANLTK